MKPRMIRYWTTAVTLCSLAATALPIAAQSVRFSRLQLTDRYLCDGITSADMNADGQTDIVAGPFWYAGPEFKTSHQIYEPVVLDPAASPSNCMFSFVHDFNDDGRPDVLVLGRVHKHQAMWYENPGNTTSLWKPHFVFHRVRGESPTLVDLNGDGRPQLVCHWEGCWGYLSPNPKNASLPWRFTAIEKNRDWPQFYHGTGVGDVNLDGRLDIVINDGWYEQPKANGEAWHFHEVRFSKERGGAQMFVQDIDADGDADIVSAVDAHGWGLAWYEQHGSNTFHDFREHLIMHDRTQKSKFGAAFTQPHALAIADINGDGLSDVVTGKRRWAHGPNGDIEPNADPVVYWFELRRSEDQVRYVPHMIDDQSGVGVQIHIADVNQDGRPDVMTSSKLGSFLFLNTP